MNAILLFAAAVFGVLSSCSGHVYRRRKYFSPVIHQRVVLPHRIFVHRYPTYKIRQSMGTVYPTRGHGPLYRPTFPANINTFHPQAMVKPNFVIPSKGHAVNTRFITPTTGGIINPGNGGFVNTGFVVPREGRVIPGDVSVVGTPDVVSVLPTFPNLGINSMIDLPPMDFNKNVIIQGPGSFPGNNVLIQGAETGIGFNTKNVDADGKPVIQEQNKNEDPAVVTDTGNGAEIPIITPVVITDPSDSVSELPITGLPDMTFPGVPDTNQIVPAVGGQKQNSSCHQTGCDTGAECVFAEEYICPAYIPSVACECRLGCRLDYTFIPLGGSITIDVCGNTCSCNNMYGATECTQRMCKPVDPTVSIAGTVSSDTDLGGFQGAFDSISEFPGAKTDSTFEFPTSSSNRITIPELQQLSEPLQVVEKIVNDSSTPFVGDELHSVIGISKTDVTVAPPELSTESPLV